MSSTKVLKGASLLSLSEIISQACSLLRNVILARYLAKADFGVAALLGTLLLVFEMTSKMAFGQQIVQSKHAEEPVYLDSLHFTQLVLSTTSAVLILLLAWPLAHVFASPQYFATIMALALVPFINGFANLDVFRQSRRLKFGPQTLSEIVPQVVITLGVWPLALYFQDYRAILCLLVAKSALNVLMSNLLSERRFSPKYNAPWLKESLRFGWPLLLAGFIQLANFQGDNMVIAANYNLTQLGEFSVALTMAMAPGLVLLRVCHSVSLPLLAEVQHDLPQLSIRYGCYVELMALLSCIVTLGMAFCGEQLIYLLFGPKYDGIGTLACCLTAVQGLRIVRGATVGAAMARGDTVNNLVSNIWRLSGLALSIGVGLLHGSLTWFALTGVAGEFIALAFAITRLAKRHAISPKITVFPSLLGLAYVLLAVLIKWWLPLPAHSPVNWLLLAMAVAICVGLFMLIFPRLRLILLNSFQKLIGRFKPAASSPS